MPCDTIQTMKVKLEACDPDAMFSALKKLKLNPQRSPETMHIIDFGGGRETIDCSTGEGTFVAGRDLNQIKVAYSTASLELTAEEFGWGLELTGKNEFTLTARF